MSLHLVANAQTAPAPAAEQYPRWTAQQANDWYAKQPWLVGANYVPSDAINELEMFPGGDVEPGS